jgi:pyrroloquinoline-quinone synthase
MRTDEVLSKLDQLISDRSILQHPFYLRWQRGGLSRAELAIYSRVYYEHVAAFPDYLANIIRQNPASAVKETLSRNLADELANPAPHSELWLDFAQAVGANRESVLEAPPVSLAAETVKAFHDLTERSVCSGVTALYCYESQQPQVATEKMRGLRHHYGITSEAGLRYFRVHAEADIEHSHGERTALATCVEDGSSPEEIDVAAEEALDAYWKLLDAVGDES